jgi:uncharacterized RDD family membrane protein YckC
MSISEASRAGLPLDEKFVTDIPSARPRPAQRRIAPSRLDAMIGLLVAVRFALFSFSFILAM